MANNRIRSETQSRAVFCICVCLVKSQFLTSKSSPNGSEHYNRSNNLCRESLKYKGSGKLSCLFPVLCVLFVLHGPSYIRPNGRGASHETFPRRAWERGLKYSFGSGKIRGMESGFPSAIEAGGNPDTENKWAEIITFLKVPSKHYSRYRNSLRKPRCWPDHSTIPHPQENGIRISPSEP